MAFTRGRVSRQRDAAQEASEEEKLERASSPFSHAARVKFAAGNLLTGPRSAGNEDTWNRLVAKFPSEDHAAVSTTVADAVLASATEGKYINAPLWRPDDEYASEVPFDVISTHSALSCPGNNGQRFPYFQSVIHTDIGREEFGRGMTSFWRRIVDEPDAFSPEFWQLFLQSSRRASPHWGKRAYRFACAWHGGRLSPQGLCYSGGRVWRRSTER